MKHGTVCCWEWALCFATALLSQSAIAQQSMDAAQRVTARTETSQENETQTDQNQSLFVQPATIRANPEDRVPLVAIVDFETSVPVSVVLEIDDGGRRWEQSFPAVRGINQAIDTPATGNLHYQIPVMGMRPGRKHSIAVRATRTDGLQAETSWPLTFQAPPLPANFPPLQVKQSRPDRMEPGITLFATNLWIDDESMMDYGYIVALDSEGEVVWYCHTKDRIADMRILANGNLLYQHGNYRVAYEIDFLGNTVRSWYASNLTKPPNPTAIGVEVDTMHHELIELPNGNFMTLATELLQVERFPTHLKNVAAPWEPANIVSDAIIEFSPRDGKIVRRIPLVDLVDRNRVGHLSLGRFWKDKYDQQLKSPSRDWMHANGLAVIPGEAAVIVSLRHLDCLMKVDLTTGRARWILGDPVGWEDPWRKLLLRPNGLVDEWQWSYHQHAPQWTSRGTLRIYDNGNYRARPFGSVVPATQNKSRVVEYAIDESTMSVAQVLETNGVSGDSFYCPFYGEADELPMTGNLLITNGGHIELEDGTPTDDVPGKRQWARIFEMTSANNREPEKVFEVICDSGRDSRYGWSIYRAQRLTDGFASLNVINHEPSK